MSNENGKLPPHNAEAEKAVLGALLLNPRAIYMVSHFLQAEDFYVGKNQQVYEAILGLNGTGQRCDTITLDAELTRRFSQNGVAWIDYITELVEYPPDEEAAVDYARIVAEKATRRRLIGAAGKIQKLAYEEQGDISSQLGESETVVFGVRGNRNGSVNVKPEEYTYAYLDMIQKLRDNGREMAGLPTGFTDIDRLLNGLQAPHHYVVAARPGMGKSAWVLNVAEHVVSNGGKVAFFALEMSHKQIMDRRVSAMTRLSCSNVIQKPWLLTTEQESQIFDAVGQLSKRQLFIEAQPAISPSELRAAAMRLHAEHELDLVIVDHLHLMRPDVARQRKDLEIADNVRALTALYKTLNVPGITVSQLSRSVESRSEKRPLLSDLRETGAIEEEAYAVIFLYRDEYYNPDTSDRPNVGEALIAKHRDGPTGAADMYWNGQLVSYKNLVRQHIDLPNMSGR